MATIQDPEGTTAAGEHAAAAKANVAAQITELLCADSTALSGYEVYVERVRRVAQARTTGDPLLVRAAVMEANVAGASWCATLDLSAP